jgi:hypothetical protein
VVPWPRAHQSLLTPQHCVCALVPAHLSLVQAEMVAMPAVRTLTPPWSKSYHQARLTAIRILASTQSIEHIRGMQCADHPFVMLLELRGWVGRNCLDCVNADAHQRTMKWSSTTGARVGQNHMTSGQEEHAAELAEMCLSMNVTRHHWMR